MNSEDGLIDTPTLKLEAIGDEIVRFTRKSDFSEAIWTSVQTWWNLVSFNRTPLSFDVATNDFSLRRGWVRTYWTDAGYSISIDPNLGEVLRRISDEIAEFESLSGNFSTFQDSSFNEAGLIRKLTDFQKVSVLSLLNMKNGANFSVPGAGKTTTTLVVWDQLKKRDVIQKMLIVAPRSAFEAWETEPKEVFLKPPSVQIFDDSSIYSETQLLLINYEKLESEDRVARIQNWVKNSPTMVVFDEAHRIKGGYASVRYKGAKEIARFAFRTEILTGTPLPQGLDDLRNLLHLSWKNIPGSYFTDQKLHGLRRGGIFVRTTKAELDLPPVTISEVHLPMGDVQSQIYSALGRNYVGQFAINASEERYLRNKGKAVFTLLAAAVNPGLLLNQVNEGAYLNVKWPPDEILADERLMSIVNNYSSVEIPPKYIWLTNLLRERKKTGSKVLVWSNFIGNLKAMERLLKPYNPALVFGGTSTEDRKNQLDKFRNDPKCLVLLSNPQTLGEGVSLHQICHEAVYVDRSYNAGHYLQSVDRIHRLGLSPHQSTQIHFLVSERSIDERVRRRLDTKIQRLGSILDDSGLVAGTLPNSDEDSSLSISDLDFHDLSDLLNHLKGLH